jgi:hypothetical protein
MILKILNITLITCSWEPSSCRQWRYEAYPYEYEHWLMSFGRARQIIPMTQAPVSTQIYESLNIHGDLFAEVTLNLEF